MSVWGEFTSDERRESMRSFGQSGEWAAERIRALEDALRDVLTTREKEAEAFRRASTATPSDITSTVPVSEISTYARACAKSSAAESRARAILGRRK